MRLLKIDRENRRAYLFRGPSDVVIDRADILLRDEVRIEDICELLRRILGEGFTIMNYTTDNPYGEIVSG